MNIWNFYKLDKYPKNNFKIFLNKNNKNGI